MTQAASSSPPSRSKRRRWPRRLVWGALAAAAAGFVITAWLPKPVPVDWVRAEKSPLVVTVNEDGRARIKDRFTVSAPLSGLMSRPRLRPGDRVAEGEELATLVPVPAPLLDDRSHQTAEARLAGATAARDQGQARVERARSALAFAEDEAKRAAALAQGNVVSTLDRERAELEVRTLRAELASAEFGVKVAVHELEMARAALRHWSSGAATNDRFAVTSPVAGSVLQVLQPSEGVVSAGASLFEIGDPGALEVVVDVLTRDAVQVKAGARASLERWGGSELEARVRLVEPSAFTRLSSLGVEEQRVNVLLELQSPRALWQSLGDGYRVEARITVWQADGVLTVPLGALFRSDAVSELSVDSVTEGAALRGSSTQGTSLQAGATSGKASNRESGWAVFVVEEEHARLRRVAVGQQNAAVAEITSGLSEGEVVIEHPSDRIRDGVAVTHRQ